MESVLDPSNVLGRESTLPPDEVPPLVPAFGQDANRDAPPTEPLARTLDGSLEATDTKTVAVPDADDGSRLQHGSLLLPNHEAA